MVNYFLVYMKLSNKRNGYKKWPVTLYMYDNETYTMLESLTGIREWLSVNKKIFFLNYGDKTEYKPILKSQILTIIGPVLIPSTDSISIQEVYTLNEAAKIWGLADGSTVRKALERGKFEFEEAKKSESTWLVTLSGMMRLFGPPNEDQYERLIINQISYDHFSESFKIEKVL